MLKGAIFNFPYGFKICKVEDLVIYMSGEKNTENEI